MNRACSNSAREILAITDILIDEIGKHGSGARFEITVPKDGFWHNRDPGKWSA